MPTADTGHLPGEEFSIFVRENQQGTCLFCDYVPVWDGLSCYGCSVFKDILINIDDAMWCTLYDWATQKYADERKTVLTFGIMLFSNNQFENVKMRVPFFPFGLHN